MGSPSPLSREIVAAAGPVLAVVGAYGTGKTEISVNLALGLAAAEATLADDAAPAQPAPPTHLRVQLADLDLVNPYFRSREAQQLLEGAGVRVVVPPGNQVFADLPIVLPEIAGLLHPPPGTVTVLDVGGDDVGARALAAFRPRMGNSPCELWMVLNSRRPFSATVDEALTMRGAIEASSRLPVTGFVANSHLVEETTIDVVMEGWHLARELSVSTGLPVRAVAVMEDLADDPALASIEAPLLRLSRQMLPPWRTGNNAHTSPDDGHGHPLPAPRATPIERPHIPISGDHRG